MTDKVASDDDAINLDSLLSGFNSEGVLEEDAEDQTRLTSNHEDLEQTLRDTNASPVVNLVNRILLQALQLGASDSTLNPSRSGCRCASAIAPWISGSTACPVASAKKSCSGCWTAPPPNWGSTN